MAPGMLKKTFNCTVIVVTKNEEKRLLNCLNALHQFNDVRVVDSCSTDKTKEVVATAGEVEYIEFKWDGKYPKKRQWCLDNIDDLKNWVLFIDADEIMNEKLSNEILSLDGNAAGYFIKGRYVYNGKLLRYGLQNNKLALIDRTKMHFPVVDDLDIPGMGEIEGHYQPIRNKDAGNEAIKQLQNPLTHYAYENAESWEERHKRYAMWEAEMERRHAYPEDPLPGRSLTKTIFRTAALKPLRPAMAFAHSYILKLGILDGFDGVNFAFSRARYYQMVNRQEMS